MFPFQRVHLFAQLIHCRADGIERITCLIVFFSFSQVHAYAEEYCDMLERGIVDPAKVTRSALQNAASIASTVLTTESVVYDKKEDKPAAPAAPDMGGMY